MVMVILVVAMMTLWLERRCGVGSGVDDGAVTTGFGCSMVGKRRGRWFGDADLQGRKRRGRGSSLWNIIL
ncbi:leucine-rich repeat extensin-like protein 3 [Iris pallida]|uniref:Leucine-rich repeat extensin-like protein 3 n=1 Tax=Iris pallida TaxID=29817 RepID=A0AAX6GMN5_IRIPA|nr:leucine-rich repeat extensin-like protein 3 [Iris pallida]